MTSLKQDKRRKSLPWLLALALALSAVVPVLRTSVLYAQNDVTLANLEERLAAAQTPEDHRAIAAFYEKQAAEALDKASKHESMAKMYRNKATKVVRARDSMIKHCTELAANYRSLADGLLALAKDHQSMASEMK